MKTKVLLVCAALMVFGLVAVTATNQSLNTGSTSHNNQTAPQHPEAVPADPLGTINGAAAPELIPDHIAYSLLFRLIANRNTEEERHSIRDYIRQSGLGRQNCKNCPEMNASDADIDSLIAAAEEFSQRMAALDNQVDEIKDRTWPNPGPEVIDQLKQLELKNIAVTNEIIASLPSRFSAGGLAKLRHHVSERVKRNTKIHPGPTTPPGGPGWKPTLPDHVH